jgi:hypothetical protein
MTLAPIDAVLRAFALLLPVREATGHNDGRFVHAIQGSTGNTTGDAWCQSATWYVGFGVLGAAWPMPQTASCHAALAYARRKGWTHPAPATGDQFFVLDADGHAHHTGFVERVDAGGRFWTLEANTNDDGSRDGVGVFRRLRGAGSDHATYEFARWVAGVGGATTQVAA